MKFRQLEYFCAVAEEKSISAAARELHVAQPPISRQIAQLEEELGVQLFLRGSKGMVLTDAGQNLYQQAQQIFQDLRRVEDSVRSVGTGMSGRIKLGVIYSAMPYALPYINRYHSKYPQVELFIRVGSPQELIEALNRGELHALFCARRRANRAACRSAFLARTHSSSSCARTWILRRSFPRCRSSGSRVCRCAFCARTTSGATTTFWCRSASAVALRRM